MFWDGTRWVEEIRGNAGPDLDSTTTTPQGLACHGDHGPRARGPDPPDREHVRGRPLVRLGSGRVLGQLRHGSDLLGAELPDRLQRQMGPGRPFRPHGRPCSVLEPAQRQGIPDLQGFGGVLDRPGRADPRQGERLHRRQAREDREHLRPLFQDGTRPIQGGVVDGQDASDHDKGPRHPRSSHGRPGRPRRPHLEADPDHKGTATCRDSSPAGRDRCAACWKRTAGGPESPAVVGQWTGRLEDHLVPIRVCRRLDRRDRL